MDFEELVRSRLAKFRVIRLAELKIESMDEPTRDWLMEESTRSITGGVIFNGRIAVVRNDWGHKYGQTAFAIFEREKDGWPQEHLGSYEVEWRGPRREEKTKEAIDRAILETLDEALKDALVELL